jgi:ABC-type Fe3+/spermidine/putrescine transport system ATPase subunit
MLFQDLTAPPIDSLRVDGLVKTLGQFSLAGSFAIHAGERIALVGKSGSGKTTLLRLIAGLEVLKKASDQGKIYLGDREITDLPVQKREIGFIFQDQALFYHFNVLENVTFGLKMKGIPLQVRNQEALIWLDRVGLKSRILDPVHQLSGGERQRVAFVRALIWRPRVLLLDEPFSALDLERRETLRNHLLELHQIWPVPMIFVSHDDADVHSIATGKLKIEWNENSALRKVDRETSL